VRKRGREAETPEVEGETLRRKVRRQKGEGDFRKPSKVEEKRQGRWGNPRTKGTDDVCLYGRGQKNAEGPKEGLQQGPNPQRKIKKKNRKGKKRSGSKRKMLKRETSGVEYEKNIHCRGGRKGEKEKGEGSKLPEKNKRVREQKKAAPKAS